MRGRGIATVIVMVAALSALLAPAAADPQAPVRILVVGDSTSQGSAGDWTWRYRLWHHLIATAGRPVDFVGSRTDLYDVYSGFGSHDYADPAFDQDHAAVWGAFMSSFPYALGEEAAAAQPDVVLLLLGVNDVFWDRLTPPAAAERLGQMVAEIRAVTPGVTVLIGDLPWSWLHGIDEYNTELTGLVGRLDTPESRVLLADTGAFTDGVDTYDGVHLTAAGEMKVAAGFADSLAAVGLGRAFVRPLPAAPNVPARLGRITVEAADAAVRVSWTDPPGATRRQLLLRDVTTGGPPADVPLEAREGRRTLTDLMNHHRYEVTMRWGKGTVWSDLVTAPVSATPRPALLRSVTALPGRHRIRLRWEPVLAASGYRVRYGSREVTTKHTRLVLAGLRAGHAYRVRVQALTDPRQPAASTRAVPTGPVPGAPRRLRAVRASLRWQPAPHATRFQVRRFSAGAWRQVGWTHRHRFAARPGLYQVTSWHQDLAGGSAFLRMG